MRKKSLWIAASCILAAVVVRPIFSSEASPASKEKVLYSFTGGSDGGYPLSDLTLDKEGNLYGTTSRGGSAGYGTVFELKRTHSGWEEQVLYSFSNGKDGATPEAGVIFDKVGALYGTAQDGSGEVGTVFKLAKNSLGVWTETTIYSFDSENTGSTPKADLVFDNKGNLYGTSSQGGNSECNEQGCGTVFELTPQADGSWIEKTIHVFTGGPDGGTPSAGVFLDSEGNIYGATEHGGTGRCAHYAEFIIPGCGTVFKLIPSDGSWTETVLHNFARGGGFGIYTSGDLFLNSSGDLVGVTQAGGDGFGTVFALQNTKKKGWHEESLHIFSAVPDGIDPVGGLVTDANGDMFGVTSAGGSGAGCFSGCGTAFEVKRLKDGWEERVLHSFGGTPDGQFPQAKLVLDPDGHLYGTTVDGGAGCTSGCGTVYEVTQ